jgi:hypothetical protein
MELRPTGRSTHAFFFRVMRIENATWVSNTPASTTSLRQPLRAMAAHFQIGETTRQSPSDNRA